MNIEAVPNRDAPPAILLRESYREGRAVKKRTLLNLSDWPAVLGMARAIELDRVLGHPGPSLPRHRARHDP